MTACRVCVRVCVFARARVCAATPRLAGMFVVGAVASFGRVTLLKLAGERLVARLRTQTFAALLAKGEARCVIFVLFRCLA